ncbi:uncharacterized protein FSUBG_9373 [Fusarium subglutinans]|uniref:Uncharacterized protein n=1 Tax=Gibberella subglutinans TaxID=42677 RepID=A0A8H5PDN4_GIBSU|nr:uncharacterized protein FSUBG_9373 [Fusarium subglutinans]KAF5594607.1 hypothetical protein FSUBG_9373 [Fusarium subglutinans]
MTASAFMNSDELSNAGGEPSQAAPKNSPKEKASSKSRKILKQRTLRTINFLRTALPVRQETFDLVVDNSAQGPRFGDLSMYNIINIVDPDEKYLWETEVNRIIAGLDKPQHPLDSAMSHQFGSSISNLGFAWLERVSDQLLCALSMCALDDNLMTAPELRTELSNRGSIILRSFDKLETRLGSKLEIIRNAGISERETSRRHTDMNSDDQYVLRNGVSGVDDSEAPNYYHLVDYVTETVARLLCQSFTSDETDWVSFVITALVKCSTKLKVLSRELPEYGVEALNKYADVRRLLMDYPFVAAENPSEISLNVTAVDRHGDRNPDPDRGLEDRYVATYASDMIAISNWLFRILWHILKDLNTRNTRNRHTDEFEVSSVVFTTAARCLPAIAFQNRLGHISGSSSGVTVGIYRRAIDLLSKTTAMIDERTRQEPGLGMVQEFLNPGRWKETSERTSSKPFGQLNNKSQHQRAIGSGNQPVNGQWRSTHTLSIMSGCAILVLGGLMAGFFVGSRIEGVDPFNLTMFAWIIAGFIILVSKSLRVGEWTWREFLKGRVTCRTVRELASVTNLPEQDIIMHLLSSERETPLVFRGPYNNVFSNTGGEGFSVDIKPTVATLFASGLIVLEVILESGSALVCLDIRPRVTAVTSGTEDSGYGLDMVAHGLSKQRMVHRQREQCRVLACKDPPLQDETEKDILFRRQLLHWEKIMGVYNRPSQSVR